MALATGVLLLSSCSEDAVDEQQSKIQIFGNITELTRVANKTAWQSGDQIGTYLYTDVNNCAETNIPYQTAGDGQFSPVRKALYVSIKNGAMEVAGYYPYSQDIISTEYRVDNWADNDDPRLDLLWGHVTCAPLMPAVMINFHHQFTKITFEALPSDLYNNVQADELKDMTVRAERMNYPVSVNLLSGELSYTDALNNDPINVVMHGNKGELIFAPEQAGHDHTGRTIVFTTRDEYTYRWELDDDMVYEAGKAYKYKLKFSKDQVEAELEGTIVDWSTVEMGEKELITQ